MTDDDWSVFEGCGVCPLCRRVTPASRPCDLDGAAIRAIASGDDKQALIDAVWGPAEARVAAMRKLNARMSLRQRALAGLGFGGLYAAMAAFFGMGPSGEILSAAEPWPLFSYNVVHEQTFQIGERIEVFGAVERQLDPRGNDATYREAAASFLVPRGVPMVGGGRH